MAVERSCQHCRATFRTPFERCPNDGARLLVLDRDPLEGAMLGPYAIGERLGEGAMGRIYRARHADGEVALKVLFGDVAAVAGMMQRFAHEAEATRRLAHPNIVSVIDTGATPEGLLYLAMTLVEGRPLSELVAAGPVPWPRAVAIARQLGAALAHAHAHEIVHRDLKPANVLIASDDHVWVVDFGLALDVDPLLDRTRLTSAHTAIGTPAYAAPEQQLGTGVVDGRADLFSLGVTLFELLAGSVPFDGTAMEVICQNAMADRPTIASRAGVAVPASLEAIVQRLLCAEPAERFASATELLAALDAVAARPRRRRLATIAATALPLIALGLVLMRSRPEEQAESEPPPPSPLPAPAHVEPPAPAHDLEPPPPATTHEVEPPARPHAHVGPRTEPKRPRRREPAAKPDTMTKAEAAMTVGPMTSPPQVHVELAHLAVHGAVAPAEVRSALERATGDLRACYRGIAQYGLPTTTMVSVKLVIDVAGHASGVDARGGGLLAACVAAAFDLRRDPAAPGGTTAAVTFEVVFGAPSTVDTSSGPAMARP